MTVSDKDEAIRHIRSLYPIWQSKKSDQWWLEEIEKYGIQNLPEDLLIQIAERQLREEGM